MDEELLGRRRGRPSGSPAEPDRQRRDHDQSDDRDRCNDRDGPKLATCRLQPRPTPEQHDPEAVANAQLLQRRLWRRSHATASRTSSRSVSVLPGLPVGAGQAPHRPVWDRLFRPVGPPPVDGRAHDRLAGGVPAAAHPLRLLIGAGLRLRHAGLRPAVRQPAALRDYRPVTMIPAWTWQAWHGSRGRKEVGRCG